MADKINLNKNNFDEEYEPTDSEDDLDEDERELLQKARQRRKHDDGEHEVLGFDEDDSEEDAAELIGASDIEDGDEYDGVPDEKAWGKKRSSYYNTDFVDQDYSTYNEQEEEQALQEELEAKAIQQRLAKQLDEADFSLDVYSEIPTDQDSIKEDKTKFKADLSQLPSRQKLQLFNKDSPEFNGLVHDFEHHLQESETLLTPILQYAKENDLQLPIIDFVRTKNNLTLTYCTNVGFYLILKAKRTPIKNHPVVKRLVQMRELLLQLEDKYQNEVKPKLEEILEAIKSGVEITAVDTSKIPEKKKSKKLNALKLATRQSEEDEELSEYDSDESDAEKLKGSSDDEEEQVDEEDGAEENEDDRRGITYQIAKNKGLTPHRKKEFRNPRVKHRNKYRKAIIRRKGAVRTVRKELKRYGGEISGIKASVKKGIKIKS